MDTQIASIAIQHNLTIATRNIADFHSVGVSLVDPWRAS
jgi:predicted nucleic acid-binding protein